MMYISSTVSITIAAIVAMVIIGCVKWFLSGPNYLPPGPRGLPVFGVALQLWRSNIPFLEQLVKWSKKYGDVMTVPIGPFNVIFLNSAQACKTAFQNPLLNDRPSSPFMEEATGSKTSGIVLSQGETSREQRQFVHSVFRHLGVGKKTYEDMVMTEMDHLMTAIEEEKGQAFDPNDLLPCAVSNIVCTLVFGKRFEYTDSKFHKILFHNSRRFEIHNAGGLALYVPLPGLTKIPIYPYNDMTESMSTILGFVQELVDEHRKEFDANNPRDFIDYFLKKVTEIEMKEDSETSFTTTNISLSATNLFTAGTETTTTSLKWLILYMMALPDIQSRVQVEMDHVIGRDRLPSLDDQKALHYTNAVISEVTRMSCVAPLGVAHSAASNTSLPGYNIPKGTIVFANIWNVCYDERIWDQPREFKPERFLAEDGRFVKREELIVFGTGKRVCIGEQLARKKVFLFFTTLLHQFIFKKPQGSQQLSLEGVLGESRNTGPFQTCAMNRV